MLYFIHATIQLKYCLSWRKAPINKPIYFSPSLILITSFREKKSQSEIWIFTIIFGGVIFSLLASSYVDRGSDTQLDQSKDKHVYQ